MNYRRIFFSRLYSLLDEHLDDALLVWNNWRQHSFEPQPAQKTQSIIGNVHRTGQELPAAKSDCPAQGRTALTLRTNRFGSPAYFTKSFREVYGMTPGDYIRSRKPDLIVD